MGGLDQLAAYIDRDTVRVVVETVAGSSLKADYDPQTAQFVATRELPLGLVHPFDFGFVPGTRGEDGDPVDALILHRGPGFPGLVVPCRVLGMVVFRQRQDHQRKPVTNNRVIAVPTFHDSLGLAVSDDVPDRVRRELEAFFAMATGFTDKEPVVSRWTGAEPAHAYLERVLTIAHRPGDSLSA